MTAVGAVEADVEHGGVVARCRTAAEVKKWGAGVPEAWRKEGGVAERMK